MLTVDASVGTNTANSYVTVAEADSYFEASFGRGLWASAVAADKDRLVVYASRTLDAYITWDGYKSDPGQSMEWPRTGTYDKVGTPYLDTIIPMPVKFAVFELAYHILSNGALSFSDQTIDEVKVGPVAVEFAENSVDYGIPSFVEQLIGHVGNSTAIGRNAAHTVRLVRA